MSCPREECASGCVCERKPSNKCASTGVLAAPSAVKDLPPSPGAEDRLQIGLLGSDNVGKSAIIHKLVSGEQLKEYNPTQYEVCTHSLKDGKVRIVDTGGDASNSEAIDKNIMESNGFILVYDITRQETFDELKKIRAHVLELKKMPKDVPMVIVANKSDLNPQRAVLTKDGRTLAQSLGCPFFETSMVTGENINEAFEAVVTEISRAAKRSAGGGGKGKGCCVLL